MEMERVTEFPLAHLDRRPRKRARLGWDVSQVPKAQVGIFCGQEVGSITSYASSGATPDHIISSSLFVKGVARNGSPPWREDDKDGHYMFAIGENLTSRYKIHSKMGEGTFGQVLECWDRERKEMVAIKIVRGIKKYREAAMIEIEVLQQLGKHDKGGNRCVQIRNWFDYRNHICIVFEKLGPSLYDFLRKNNYRSFPIDLVREIGRQLLECVAFMHDLHLIHTDLKPENILLVSADYIKVLDYKGSSRAPKESSYLKRVPKSSAIKVIDFGSTTYERQDQNYIVSTRHYRAPEVILGLGWSYPCDIWSVGCILVELCTGEALFQTHENLEHLAMMERVFGPLPQHMLKRIDRHAEKYIRRGRLDWPEGATSRESIKAVLKLPRLQNLVMQHVDHSAGDLIHLLQGLLRYEPSDRLTALAILFSVAATTTMAGLSRLRLATATPALRRLHFLATSRAYGSAAAVQYDYDYDCDDEYCSEEGGGPRLDSAAASNWGRGMHWVLIGDPGAQKHVYAEKLSKLLQVPHISMGSLLRQEYNPSSSLYIQIASALNEGKLVPEEVIFGLLSKRLEECYSRGETGFILDGIPRTRIQAEILDQIADINLVVNFKCAEENLVKRDFLTVRNTTPSVTDARSALKEKFRIYAEQGKALEDYYRKQKKLVDFQVAGAPGETWQGLLAALQLKHLSAVKSSQKLAA